MADKQPHDLPTAADLDVEAAWEVVSHARASVRARLQEAEDILRAIRQGEIDALAIQGHRGPQIHTLSGSEHPYRVLVESMSEGAVTLTAEGEILFCNPAFVQLLGLAPTQIIRSELQRYIQPEDRPLLVALLRRGVKERSKGELRLLVSGAVVPVLLSLSALNLDGLPCACLIITDLREQKRKQEILASERLTNSILDQAAEAIIVCDPAGLVNRANQKAQSLCGFNPVLAVFDEAFPIYVVPAGLGDELTPASIPLTIADVMRGEIHGSREVLFKPGNQRTPLSMLLSAGPVRSSDNDIIGYVVSLVDISERKQAEHAQAELLRREQQARAEAQAANQAKDIFLATLSHELRTPLSAVLGWVRLLRDAQSPQIADKAIEVIERNAHIQAQLIDDILDISRIVSGKISLAMGVVNLTSITGAAIESVRLAAEAKGITLRTTHPDDPQLVLGDAGRLQQVIWNLLSNATKFTPRGGAIEVQLHGSGQHVVVSVSDSGRGIPADFLPYIFDRFRQADGSTTRLHGGLGLGLAIARYLVEAHGGTLTAASPGHDQGSTFTVQFPRASQASVALQPLKGSVSAVNASSAARSYRDRALLTGLRVLIVDDQPDTLSFLAVVLQQHGAQVSSASSAATALRLLTKDPPDVLVSDIAMPESDGYHLIQALRARETADHIKTAIPAIALSALARSIDVDTALQAGFQRHLAKPVDIEELVTAVAMLGRAHHHP